MKLNIFKIGAKPFRARDSGEFAGNIVANLPNDLGKIGA